MELSFTELNFDDLETNEPENFTTYFDEPLITTTQKKPLPILKKSHPSTLQKQTSTTSKQINNTQQNPNPTTSRISFDDILKNMNLTLLDGKLIFAPPPPSSKKVHFETVEETVQPLTKTEILKKKLLDYANYRNEIIYASKIKSTQLQFTNNNNPTIYTRQTPAFNRLFPLKK
jgi:hypothetical protein